MKKLGSTLLAGLIVAQTLLLGAVSTTGVDSYYNGIPTIDGETSRTVDYIYDGVTRTDFVLSESSKYAHEWKNVLVGQHFSTLEFDPSQDDLYLEVTGGTYISSLIRPSTAINNYNSAHSSEGKTAIAATNGDLWLMVNNRIFTSGSNQNCTKGYVVPMGFAMYGGELVCTQDLTTNGSWSFGVAEDGTALIGYLSPNIKATNQTTGNTITVDGINRTPENNYLVMYTDQGFASNHSMNDAYEVIIDCDYDYTVRAGTTITGKVTAITKPGGTKYNCTANRIVLTARGDKLSLLSGFSIGDTVSVKVDINDANGNTEKWYTVNDIVSGHFPHVMNGIATEWPSGQNYCYPATVIGIKHDGNVIIMTDYGRQSSTGYSAGLWISDMPEILVNMGVKWAFMLDGGGSSSMICENSSGSYEMTGRNSDSGSATIGVERGVINNIILAVGPSKSGAGTTDVQINGNTVNDIVRNTNNIKATQSSGNLSLITTGFKNPYFYFDLFGGTKADSYKYAVIEGTPTDTGGGTFTMGVYPSAGRTLDPDMSASRKLTFNCDGSVQRKLLDLSTLSSWTGRMNYLRMDLFDDTGIGNVGDGINISKVKFFSTAAQANAYINRTSETVPGDADGSHVLNLADVTLILKKIAGWTVTVKDQADFNNDGTVNLADVTGIMRQLVS